MAKDKKNVPTSQHPEKTRVTAYLSAVESALFSSLCNLFDVNAGDGLATMVWTTYNALESGQREAVGAMARAKTGLSRLPSGPKVTKSAPVDAVQGGSATSATTAPATAEPAVATSQPAPAIPSSPPATGSDKLADRLTAVMNKAVDAPISTALAEIYGEG